MADLLHLVISCSEDKNHYNLNDFFLNFQKYVKILKASLESDKKKISWKIFYLNHFRNSYSLINLIKLSETVMVDRNMMIRRQYRGK